MKCLTIRLSGMGIVVLLTLGTFGCITSNYSNRTQSNEEYCPEQYPLEMKGNYFGHFISEGIEYYHYYFKHYPWPTNYSNGMGVVIPAKSTGKIVVIPINDKSYSPEPYINMYQTWMNDIKYFYEARKDYVPIEFPKPDSDEVLNKPARLFVTIKEGSLPDGSNVAGEECHFLHIVTTRNGPGSVFRIGEREVDGKISWGTPQMLNIRPTHYRWRNWWDRSFMIVNIPLDIVTMPVLIPYRIMQVFLPF